MIRNLIAGVFIACLSLAAVAQTADTAPNVLPIQPAHAWADPTHAMLLDVGHAGARIVAVGEHGIVLLSDDGGRSYRQARQVPASSTLTAVCFADARHGWAVGQFGVILATDDGGETWTLQRSDTSIDQPLFSVYFKDDRHGWAVGLWSLLLETEDGGRNWKASKLPTPPGGGKADRNLLHLFADRSGTLFIAAEQGLVLRSHDDGATWQYLKTGNRGSLWAGTATADGTLFVGGLLGHLYRSHDGGDNWEAVDSESTGSITDLVASGNRVLGVALDGYVLNGTSASTRFSARQRADRAALTALAVLNTGQAILLSKAGILTPQ